MTCTEHNGHPSLQAIYHNRFNDFSYFTERLCKALTMKGIVSFTHDPAVDSFTCSISAPSKKDNFREFMAYAKKGNLIDAFFEAIDQWEMRDKGE